MANRAPLVDAKPAVAWRSELLPASFKGVEFFLDSAELTVGRRTVVQKFPLRKTVLVQDLGEEAEQFQINAYVIGPSYKIARDALVAKLLQVGSGTLVYPYRGPTTVTVIGDVKIGENKNQGGFATVQFQTVETDPEPTNTKPDSAQNLRDKAAAVKDAGAKRMGDDFKESSHNPLNATGGAISKATESIAKANRAVNSRIGKIDATTAKIELFTKQLDNLISAPEEMAAAIGELINSAFSSIRTTEVEAVSVIEKYGSGALVRTMINGALIQAKNFGKDIERVIRGTSAANQQADNQQAIVVLMRHTYLAETATVISSLPFESYEQAIATKKQFKETIDDIVLTANDTEYASLRGLSSAVSGFLAEAAKTLPEIGSYTPSIELPSVVIAHILYGDATREAEIVDRNSIRHPGFVPQGQALEVLHE